jgi:Trypsin-like peptidase domain
MRCRRNTEQKIEDHLHAPTGFSDPGDAISGCCPPCRSTIDEVDCCGASQANHQPQRKTRSKLTLISTVIFAILLLDRPAGDACARFSDGDAKFGIGTEAGDDAGDSGDEQNVTDTLRAAGGRLRRSAVLLFDSEGNWGTGFVVSKKDRLVVTAGHVAESFLRGGLLVGLFDRTDDAASVTRAWLHPETLRKLDQGLVARSLDPNDGEISPRGPDLAIVELSNLDSRCDELHPATDREIQSLDGQAGGVLGYWGSVTNGSTTDPVWRANATFATVRIRASADQFGNENLPSGERRWIWFTGTLGQGASGSPLFTATGRVAAIYLFWTPCPDGSRYHAGLRIDSVQELAAYHKLELANFAPQSSDLSSRAFGPDPHLKDYRKAVTLVRTARSCRAAGEYRRAFDLYDESLSLAPQYGGAFLERSKTSLFFLHDNWRRLTTLELVHYAELALSDSRRCVEMFPDWNYARLIFLQSMIFLLHLQTDQAACRLVISDVDDILSEKRIVAMLTSWERSFATNCRAQCFAFLGDDAKAQIDYAESIRLAPLEPRWYVNRAYFWEAIGRNDLANADRLKARTLGARPQ